MADPSFDFLVFPTDPSSSTPTNETFTFPPFSSSSSSSSSPPEEEEHSADISLDWTHQLDPLLYHQAFEGGDSSFPSSEFDAQTIELGDIAPLPGLVHSYPPPSNSNTATLFSPYTTHEFSSTYPATEYDSATSPSSHHSSMPQTPPSAQESGLLTPMASTPIVSVDPQLTRKQRMAPSTDDVPHIYARKVPISGSSTSGSPEPQIGTTFLDESDCQATGAPTGKGKKRKQLPSTKEFQHPDVSGLSKKEARLVKNRAAAFLSRQRKREQFDEMAIHVEALEAENARLKSLVSSADVKSTTCQPIVSPESSTPLDTSMLVRLQADLSNLRTLLHQSTSREAMLEVELASLRSQLQNVAPKTCPSCRSAIHPPTRMASLDPNRELSPMLSAGLTDQYVSETSLELGRVGAKRSERDRSAATHQIGVVEGKRVGGVALMVILFSFALFTFPSTGGLATTLRAPPKNTALPGFLGRVLSASTSAGYGGVYVGSTTPPQAVKAESEEEIDGVCELTDRTNATDSSLLDRCDLPEPQPPQSAEELNNLDPWQSIDLSSPMEKKSLSLTLVRPVPSTPADLLVFQPSSPFKRSREDDKAEGVNSILERWLGLNLDEGTMWDSSTSTEGIGSQSHKRKSDSSSFGMGLGLGGSEGWVLVDSPVVQAERESEKSQAATTGGEVEAWDGTRLEKMALDEIVEGAGLEEPTTTTTSVAPSGRFLTLPGPSSPSGTSTFGTPPYGAGSASTSETNGSFVRLDLELEIGVKRRDIALVDRDEVGRLLKGARGVGLDEGGLKGLPGSWGVI
ncbi:Basic-leucine zipper domain [Phaffia rhodozyma]|uniref:Basic-leucine zipper domain n=1 Tax=Phaffia rhodozyma TaxID=264483 RepID=A0A0F7SN24_PHARH|nr:Basic-leucine zipper domain [Phaffia rhodozyma]